MMFDTLSEKFSTAFKNISGKGKISESNIEDTLKLVRTALLEADVNFKVVKSFVEEVKVKALGEKVLKGVNPGEQFVKIVHDELAKIMGGESTPVDWKRPFLPILVVGLNGAGKTTLSGKLALYLRTYEKKDVLLIPADTFRPAAKDQLMTLAKNMGIDCYDSDLSKSPAELAVEGIKFAKAQGKSIAIVDTAGRLHVDDVLMAELVKVKKAIEDQRPEVLMVADAMTGQEAVNVATAFHSAVGLTGIVLSKMDSDARGGAALSIKSVTGVPVRFLSTGEKMKDLEVFYPDRMAGRILDMGDVVTLVEKAQEMIDEKASMDLMGKIESNQFNIDDFMKQMEIIGKMGSFGSLMKMIPGLGGLTRQLGDLSQAEVEMKKMKIMVSSMTTKERKDERLLTKDESRRKRIAQGSGTDLKSVNEFITKFQEMKKMMKGMMGMMNGGGMGGMFGPQKGFRNPPGGGMALPGGMDGGGKKKGDKSSKGKSPWGKSYF
jgi:signal recognition particle subunit SRP54